MYIDRLETHDRFDYFTKQSFHINDCLNDILEKRPFGNVPFYIFSHARTEDNGVDKRLIWQPRLSKPKAQTNSMLFRAIPFSTHVDIIWIIPDRLIWPEFSKGKITHNPLIEEFIHLFQFDREELERPNKEDVSEEKANEIYKELSAQYKKNKMKLKPNA